MKSIIALAALSLMACNREEKPEAPTGAETARLDDAEEMLNDLAANDLGPGNAEASTGPKHRADEQSGQ